MDYDCEQNQIKDKEKSPNAQERFKNIVRKARQARNNKLLNESLDKSFGMLRRRPKRKNDLSQSFVMRQACALSAKNKEIISKYLEARDINVQLEQTLRSMQHSQMSLMIKLNSREVELDECLKKLKHAEDERDELMELFGNMQKIIASVQICNTRNKRTTPTKVNFSVQPRRSRAKKSVSPLPNTAGNKWQPDLTIIQEKSQVLANGQEPRTTGFDERVFVEESNDQLSLNSSALSTPCSENRERQSMLEEILELGRTSNVTNRKSRRRSSLFSSASFDLDTATYDDSDESVPLPDDPDIDESGCDGKPDTPPFVRLSTETAQSREDFPSLTTESAQEGTPNKDCQSQLDEDRTTFELISMEATDPLDSSIVLGGTAEDENRAVAPDPPTAKKKGSAGRAKRSSVEARKRDTESDELPDKAAKPKRRSSAKPRASATGAKQGKRKNAKKESAKSDPDYFNCSNDSFLINPDKKIKLREETENADNQTPKRPRPMSDVTNDFRPNEHDADAGRRRRRTGPVSYKEPSLVRKMRRNY